MTPLPPTAHSPAPGPAPAGSPATNRGPRGSGWVVTQSLLMAAAILLAIVFPGDWTRLAWSIAGAILFASAAVFGLAGVARLGRNRTPFPQPRAGSTLVQTGIYGLVRHPLYTSVMLATTGWALIWQSPASLVASLVLIPFFVAKARCEERLLQAMFPDYRDYARRVPRFLPRLLPRPRSQTQSQSQSQSRNQSPT